MEQNEGFWCPDGSETERGAERPVPIHELNDPTRLHMLLETLPATMNQPTNMPGASEAYVWIQRMVIDEVQPFEAGDVGRRYEAFLRCKGWLAGYGMGFRLSQIVMAYQEEPPRDVSERVRAYQAWMNIDVAARTAEMDDYLCGHGGRYIAANLLWPEGVLASEGLHNRDVKIRRTDSVDGSIAYTVNTADPNWQRWCHEGTLAGLWFMRAHRTEQANDLTAEALPARLDAALGSLLDQEL